MEIRVTHALKELFLPLTAMIDRFPLVEFPSALCKLHRIFAGMRLDLTDDERRFLWMECDAMEVEGDDKLLLRRARNWRKRLQIPSDVEN